MSSSSRAAAAAPRTSATASSSSSAQQQQQGGLEEEFTEEMRDRQARGKDPYTKDRVEEDEEEEGEDDEEEDEDDGDEEEEEDEDMDLDEEEEEEEEDDGLRMQIGNVPKNETFEERQTRQFALAVLDSPEQLMMYAQSTNDSIPGQRYRFMTTLCGFAGEEERVSPTAAPPVGGSRRR